MRDCSGRCRRSVDGATEPGRGEVPRFGPQREYEAVVGCIEDPDPAATFRTATGAFLTPGEQRRVLDGIDRLEPLETVRALADVGRGCPGGTQVL